MSRPSHCRPSPATASALLLSLLLSACTTANSFLAGASSMRVQVDVYKGPLANQESIQKGQLTTLIGATHAVVSDTDAQLVGSMCRIGCIRGDVANLQHDPLLPTREKCSERHIPQRRALQKDCLDGYCERSENAYNPPDVSPWNGKPIVHGTPPDTVRPRDNKHNVLETNRRFPEFAGTAYQTCPVYVRMRTQLAQLQENTRDDAIEAGAFLAFRRQIADFKYLADPDSFLSGKTPEAESICGAGGGNCTQHLSDFLTRQAALRQSYSELLLSLPEADPAAADSQLRNAAVSAYFANARQVAGQAGLAAEAAKATLAEVEAQLGVLDTKAKTTDVAVGLNASRELLINALAVKIKPENLLSAARTLTAVLPQTLPSAPTPELARLPVAMASFRAAVNELAEPARARSKAVLDAQKLFDDAAKGDLKATIIRLKTAGKIATTDLATSKTEAAALNLWLDSLATQLAPGTPLQTQLTELEDRRKEQSGLRDDYEATLSQFELTPWSNDADVAQTKAMAEKRLTQLQPLRIVLRKSAISWSADPSGKQAIVAITGIADDLLAQLTSIYRAELTLPLSADSNATIDKITALQTELGTKALPELSLPSPDEYKNLRDGVVALAELALSSDGTAPAEPFGAFIGTLAAATTNLEQLSKAMQEEGLNQPEQQKLTSLRLAQVRLKSAKAQLGRASDSLASFASLAERAQDENDKGAYARVSELAGAFRVLATGLSYQLVSVEPHDKRLLIDMTKAANMAAEFANQLTARANALSIQAEGYDRSVVSTGQYLRDSQPTAFIELYRWLNAATEGKEAPPDERVRIGKRLFDDDNWARINEVYASGAGETSMAFIKDDIGNWNLKSFINDPTKLTKAYAELGTKLVKKAAELASGGASGAARIPGLLDTARATQAGQASSELRAGALIGGLDLVSVRKEMADKLDAILKEFETQEAAVNKEFPAPAEGKPDEQKAARDAKLNPFKETARKDSEAVVAQYSQLIEALQRVAAVKDKAEP